MNERIDPHYHFLKKYDKERWNNFRAELMRLELFTTFERSILKNEKVTLVNLPSWVRTCMVRFMPWWSQENFDTLTWPQLPELETAE
ncbi:hypothetical protein GO730_05580 [Spirosoma sp. HMF3257]|uniref:Uncharacterized protein n=1 Tax=Spirosoma telluris TaxID=2183553 RepID=A0A327NMW8_9BACT|nr:hypothetical protein [Spirosoma telluris]RAI73948.1 hypothetical protein HMF3257_05550 [Spirosoma telluris]